MQVLLIICSIPLCNWAFIFHWFILNKYVVCKLAWMQPCVYCVNGVVGLVLVETKLATLQGLLHLQKRMWSAQLHNMHDSNMQTILLMLWFHFVWLGKWTEHSWKSEIKTEFQIRQHSWGKQKKTLEFDKPEMLTVLLFWTMLPEQLNIASIFY